MTISSDYPPNIALIRKYLKPIKGTIFTYGQTIHNPDEGDIDEPLMLHETTHAYQQGGRPEIWWDRYLLDKDFRFVQELEAYQIQYQRYCQLNKDRNQRNKFLIRIASDLSSSLYGNLCTIPEAMTAIKSNLKFNVNSGDSK